MLRHLARLLTRREDGQTLAEYALILAFIAVLAIAAVTFLGEQISTLLSSIGTVVCIPVNC
jgi:Flp pilus assembly pilin Flp